MTNSAFAERLNKTNQYHTESTYEKEQTNITAPQGAEYAAPKTPKRSAKRRYSGYYKRHYS